MTDLLVEIIEQGLIFSILGFGVFITFKVLDFADMTTDGSFILGASIFGSLIAHVKVHPIIALFIVMIGGALAGLCPESFILNLRYRAYYRGLSLCTALYTVNLRVLKSPNLPLFRERTLLQWYKSYSVSSDSQQAIVSLFSWSSLSLALSYFLIGSFRRNWACYSEPLGITPNCWPNLEPISIT